MKTKPSVMLHKVKGGSVSSALQTQLSCPPALADGWSYKTIGDLVVRTKQRNPSVKPNERFTYVDVSAVSNTSFRITSPAELVGSEAPSRARKVINADDVIFATVRPTLKRVALVPQHFHDQIASTGYAVLRADREKVIPAYLYFQLLADSFITRMGELQRGASYPAIRDTDILNETIAVPTLSEQKKIAAVLGVVQRAMEQQERLQALTAELRNTIMRQLFAKGLHQEPQKETDFGLLPKSWELRAIGELGLDIGDGNYSTKYPRQDAFQRTGVPFLRANNMVESCLVWDDMRYISPELHETLKKGHTKKDDVCLVTRGNIGEVAYVTDEFVNANMNAQLVRINGGNTIDGKFLYFALTHPAIQSQFQSLKTGTALQQLPIGKLKFVRIPIPSREEQVEIANTLWLVSEKLSLIIRKRSALDALFRTLLHQLLTAQVRVRDLDWSEIEGASAA
jgi:type I restriction enzyme S subunit